MKPALPHIDENWRLHARCRVVDPDVMTPPLTDSEAVAAAKTVCAGCPVKAPCLQFAIESRDEHSILAGLAPGEGGRRKGRKQHRRSSRELGRIALCKACKQGFPTNRPDAVLCRTCVTEHGKHRAPGWVLDRGDEIAAFKRDGKTDKQVAEVLGTHVSIICDARQLLGIRKDGTVKPRQVAA